MLVEVVVFFFVTSLLLLKWHLEHHFSQFKRLGIKGPEPSRILGNLREIRSKGQFAAVQEWTKIYGRVFGYFEGYTPVLVVSEPEVLRNVLLKDAPNFMKRKPFPLAPRKSLGLFLEDGTQWKRSRTMLTPAFSTGKLKMMMPVMTESSEILVERLTERVKEDSVVDVYEAFQSLTLDVIGRCAFGLRTQAQVDKDDIFLVKIRQLFAQMSTTIIQPIVMAFPFVSNFIFAVKNIVFLFGMNPVVWLRNSLRAVIKARKEIGPNANIIDLVQLMLFPDMSHHNASTDFHERALTDREIVAQSMTFLLAGYETTSAVLACFTHLMATNPDIQAKIMREIEENVGTKDINYENLQDLPFFDAAFDEVCRLYPTASFIVTRQAAETRCYGDLTIPSGMNVMANVWALHRDEEFWEEPDTFDPTRFLHDPHSRRASFTFLPFGAGPRHCIGMRFATLEAKITIVNFIRNFLIERAENTPDELEMLSRGAVVPKDDVKVKLTKRVTSNRRRHARHC